MSFWMILIGVTLLCNEDPNFNCVGIILIFAGACRFLFGTGVKPETSGSPEVSANVDSSNYEI